MIRSWVQVVPMLAAFIFVSTGCSPLGRELRGMGADLIYPFQDASGEDALAPGQILSIDITANNTYSRVSRCPVGLKIVKTPSGVSTVSNLTSFTVAASADVQAKAVRSLGELDVSLKDSSTDSIEVDFGKVEMQDFFLDDLKALIAQNKASPDYRQHFNDSQILKPDLCVITKVFIAEGLTYKMHYTNKASFNAKARAIAQAVNAGADWTWEGERTAVFKGPEGKRYIIGVTSLKFWQY